MGVSRRSGSVLPFRRPVRHDRRLPQRVRTGHGPRNRMRHSSRFSGGGAYARPFAMLCQGLLVRACLVRRPIEHAGPSRPGHSRWILGGGPASAHSFASAGD
jgi:hypothetical protein